MPSDPYDLEEGIPKPEPGTAGGFYDAQGFWRTGWWNGQSWREGYFGGEVWVDAAWDGEVWRDGIRLYIVDESLRAAYRREFIIRIDDGALQSGKCRARAGGCLSGRTSHGTPSIQWPARTIHQAWPREFLARCFRPHKLPQTNITCHRSRREPLEDSTTRMAPGAQASGTAVAGGKGTGTGSDGSTPGGMASCGTMDLGGIGRCKV